ncbi:mitochondrial 37S ribosomal protein rsm10 [Tulasnella sp. JGI-2019a]|nr:mitochondrial 37S ribosomal protein rsm10 [Tulasnella sp. JGI-2019a]
MILRPSSSILAPVLRAAAASSSLPTAARILPTIRRNLATESTTTPTPQYLTSATLSRYEENSTETPTAFLAPKLIPPTHHIPCAIIHLRSHHTDRLQLFTHFALHAATAFSIPVSHPTALPTKRTLITVNKSNFVHKGAQENFQELVHKRAVKVWDADPTVLAQWVKYLQVNAVAGVAMKVIKWERVEVGFGGKMLEEAVKGKRASAVVVQKQVKAMADAIVKEEMRVAGLKPEDAASPTGKQKKQSKQKEAKVKGTPAEAKVKEVPSSRKAESPVEVVPPA